MKKSWLTGLKHVAHKLRLCATSFSLLFAAGTSSVVGTLIEKPMDGLIAAGLCFTAFIPALVANFARVLEYERAIAALKWNGARSLVDVTAVDPLFYALHGTGGKRRVLAAALSTLERPVKNSIIKETFKLRNMRKHKLWTSDWWCDTFSPAIIPVSRRF